MRLLFPALALALAILAGCAGRVDTASVQQRVHDQVVASQRRHPPAIASPADADDLLRQIRAAKRDLYLLSLAADDPAVAAAQEVAAARLGALTGYMAAMGLEVPVDPR